MGGGVGVAESEEALQAKWWEDWWAQDWSWAGLAAMPVGENLGTIHGGLHGELNLQDYWRRDPASGVLRDNAAMLAAGELLHAPDGRLWHLAHVPLHWQGGAWAKLGWDADRVALLDGVIAARTGGGRETTVDDVCRAEGRDGRAQLAGVVFLAPPQAAEAPLHLIADWAWLPAWEARGAAFGPGFSCNHVLFSQAADFVKATFSGCVRFESATFSGGANFLLATFAGDAGFNVATFLDSARFDNATFSGTVDFFGATFSRGAIFPNAIFSGFAGFSGARFSAFAIFDRATFSRTLDFCRATFSGTAAFNSTILSGSADFVGSIFSGDASFVSATFSGDARFDRATFSGDAHFDRATFSGDAHFVSATFSGDARFDSATFSGDARFDRATFSGDARFVSATFSGDARFQDGEFAATASFRDAKFRPNTASPQRLPRVSFRGRRFTGEARFDKTEFHGPMDFSAAAFARLASFAGLTWPSDARHWHRAFDQAVFKDVASFQGAGFRCFAAFDGAVFQGGLQFDEMEEEAAASTRFKQEMRAAIDLPAEATRADPAAEAERHRASQNRLKQLERGCRVLKQAMDKASDKTREQVFYAFELIARRKQSATPRWERAFSRLYEFFSDYSRSIAKPLFWLVLTIPGFALFYWGMAGWHAGGWTWSVFWEAATFSLRRVLPFGPVETATSGLPAMLLGTGDTAFTVLMRVVVILQSVFALAMAFLAGLALRRRFQIT